jgi:diguanylate cyclase (GGDEF)-like protein/PAS domain S-box-containing protein
MTAPENRSQRHVDRQLRKAGLAVEPGSALARFVDMVLSTYDEADDRRRLNDHAFAVASSEMAELNGRLSTKNVELNDALESLLRSEEIEQLNQELSERNEQLRSAMASQTRSQQMFETLASNAPLAIVYTEPNGRAVYANQRAADLFHVDPTELLGFGWLAVVPREQHEEFEQLLDLSTDATWVIEHELLRADGSRIWASTTVAEVRHADERAGWIANVEDISERKRNEAALERLARTDSLTGLLNRLSFTDAVQARCTELQPGDEVAVALIDMDRFKLVNDSFGHAAGDQLLVEVAEVLRAEMGPADVVARLGGDEFACARVVHGEAAARDFGRALADCLHQPFVVERQVMHTGASVGIALGTHRDADPQELLRDADTAMYRAKASSDRYRVFDRRFRDEVTRRFALERELHTAVEKREVSLAYQPIVDAVTHRAVGVEALARWTSPALGVVSPIEFIEAAEHIGLSRELGRQILDMACAQLGEWRRSGAANDDLSVSVNITYAQLSDQGFVDLVAHTLAAHGVPGSHLILELTEQALLDDFDRAVGVLDRLRKLGVRVAIDDFGTGYSALSYLARLNVDFLKIDKSFVQRLSEESDEGENRLTEAIVGLARLFDLTPIAEGVETSMQEQILRTFECDLLQGYLFARPMPGDDPLLLESLAAGRDLRLAS